MIRSLRQLISFTIFILSTSFLIAQTVSISYVNPDDLVVCDSATFEVTITNNLSDSIKVVNVVADLSAGLSYMTGSITNAGEENISNLNVPIFSLPNLGAGDVFTLTFKAATDCSLVAAINAGTLFINNYTVNYDGGSNSLNTIPYIIETPLLIITDIDNPVLTGVKGDVLTRTITIINTRLGALSKLTFSDTFNGGVEISSSQGMVSNSTPNYFELMLTGADFANFGDGDEFFELNEEITITEEILITDCGNIVPLVNSALLVHWGCNNQICQQENLNATINILPSQDNPVLSFLVDTSVPTDFCGATPNTQTLSITNNGNQPALDASILIENLTDVAGFGENSLTVQSSGVSEPADIIFNGNVNFDDCGNVTDLAQSILIIIESIEPGETVIISWESYICAVGCESPTPDWQYSFAYEKSCPEGEIVDGTGSSLTSTIPIFMVDSVTFFIGVPLADDSIYTMNYQLSSPFLVDSVGTLVVEFILPCGLGWVNSNQMILGGQAPTSITETPMGSDTLVSIEYPLPIGVFSVNSDFQVSFDCDVDCIEIPECDTVFITSCPVICSGAGTLGDFEVLVNTTINLDSLSANDCGIKECMDFEMVYQCEADSICEIDIVGYLNYDMEFNRINFGLPDNDDDRFADANGELDFNLVREDRALAGDTVRTHVEGAMHMDIPGGTLEFGSITVTFEAHTIDDGIDGGQVLNFDENRGLMTHDAGIVNLGAVLKIVDVSTGMTYKCNVPDPSFLDTLEATLSLPNTRPEVIVDEVLFMTNTYDISAGALAAFGCDIPDSFVYEHGDSVIFTAHHRVLYNVVEFGSPRIVNLRTGTSAGFNNSPGQLQVDPFVCNCQALPWQLSGYRYILNPGLYNLPPCASSDAPGGTRFDFLLGAGNFFPFEFRNLGIIEEWEYTFQPPFTLLESELIFLQLQGGATLFSTEIITPVQTGNTWEFDLSPFQTPAFDEGFSLRFRHEWEVPCTEDGSSPLSIHAQIDLLNSLPEQDPLDTIVIGSNSLRPLRPGLLLNPLWFNYTSFNNIAVWEFDFTNFPTGLTDPAPNVWIMPTSSTGLLTDFQLIDLSTGLMVPMVNGIFQLGDLGIGALMNLQLTATNNSCAPEAVVINFGWDCELYDDPNDEPCHSQPITLFVESPPGEIEMDITNPPTPVDLCDTIPYFTIEIFNAQLGAVFNINLDALLPPGLNIVPGSSQIAFPTGGTYIDVNDPTDLGNGSVRWDISELHADVGIEGLAGVSFAPNHSVSVRFRSTTECGFIASSQIVFTANATQNCDLPTNTLSKASDPINITGVVPPYAASVTISTNGPPVVSCGEDLTFSINVQPDGFTLESDSIFIILPPGAIYNAGSYQAGSNAVNAEPLIDLTGNQQTLKWPIIDGLTPNTIISFEVTASNFGIDGCEDGIIRAISVQKQEAICVTDGELCSILVETGSNEFPVTTEFPEFEIDAFGMTNIDNMTNFDLQISNSGENSDIPLQVDFYIDVDGNGELSPGDILVQTETYNNPISAGEVIFMNGVLQNIPYEQLCNLIAVVDADNNCGCETDAAQVTGPLFSSLPNVIACSNEDTDIGIPNESGHNYNWMVPFGSVACPNCAMTTFSFENNTDTVALVELTLVDDNGGGCQIQSTMVVSVMPEPLISAEALTICQGEEVELTAIGGTTYVWTGPGISDPSLQSQTVAPIITSTYSVEVTDTANCVNTVSISIEVSGMVTMASADTLLCQGESLVLPSGNIVNTPGIHCDTLTTGDCPAINCITLAFQNPEVEEDILLCEGDSILIGETFRFEPFDTCLNEITVQGCDILRCISIMVVDTPSVDVPMELCISEGESATLDLGGGFSSYSIDPFDPDIISCNDCPNPVITPIESGIFTVLVTDINGCTDEDILNVVLLPPCGSDILRIPSAFSPNGDGENETFGLVDDGTLKIFHDEHVSITVYNRWGQKVFEGSGYDARWDGTHKGKAAASETYVYVIEVSCGEDMQQVVGDVSLLR